MVQVTEAGLLQEVHALCGEFGLLVHHCRDSRACDGNKGLPDLIIAGPGGVIFAELKSEDGERSADQDLWAWTLTRACDGGSVRMDYQLWRPTDLTSGLIRAELERIAK